MTQIVLDPGHQHRAQVGTRGVDGGAVTGRSGTDDQNFGVFGRGHKGVFNRKMYREKLGTN